MKSTRLLLSVLGILLAITLVLYFTKNTGTISSAEKNFSTGNVQETDEVIIHQDTLKIKLNKEAGGWRLNNLYPAKNEAILLLLNSLQRLEVISPLPRSYQAIAAKKLENTGIYVEIHSKKSLNMAFYLDYDTSEITGSIILNKKSKTPFLVKLKGYAIRDITGVFSTDILYWRDNLLFNYNSEEIASVTVNYTSEQSSFKILYESNGPPQLFNAETGQKVHKVDLKSVNDYLYFFSNIKYYRVEKALVANLNNEVLFATIHVENRNNEILTVNFYRKVSETSLNGKKEYDLNTCFAVINDEQEPVMLRYFDIDPILSDLNEFLKK